MRKVNDAIDKEFFLKCLSQISDSLPEQPPFVR